MAKLWMSLVVLSVVAIGSAGCGSSNQPGTATAPAGTAVSEPQRTTPDGSISVSSDNFVRAESDLYLGRVVRDGGFGKFYHTRELSPMNHQVVVRQNRDTLYSAAVFDLQAGPVTISMPDPGDRFQSLQIITEDHYNPNVFYGKGDHTLDQKTIGTRYVIAAVRTLVNPSDPADLGKVHALQDAITVKQDHPGTFEVPRWDQASQTKVRDALRVLASALPPDTKGMFGAGPADVDPVRHLIGSASAWGGNRPKDATYLMVNPPKNDGNTVYRLTAKDVPVDGFWSVTVYNKDGYFTPNPQNAYSFNNLTAAKGPDGAVTIQFGGCTPEVANCLPITPGWNYTVRMYRPQQSILDGTWTFPAAQPV
ncbi:hypothetical protein M2432_004677 [Mycobacterium sp. OTB74]|nr:DUF1254 domain-containing protein [Mycobacterium sp. OTB74]MDH6247014.1 hypothetical protein [Mycobacterium sp. OTB74]